MLNIIDTKDGKPILGQVMSDVDLGDHSLTCGGTASGQSTIASGLVVNDSGGNTAADDFRAETVSVENALEVDASADQVKINTDILLTDVPADTDNTVLILDSSNQVKQDEIDSRVWGSSLLDYTGTPVNNQLAIFTDSNTVEGDANLTYDGSELMVNNDISIPSDTKKVLLGAEDDMSVFYDGTDGNIDTSLVAASDLEITCGANKTLELQNVVYEDIRVSSGNIDRPGGSDPSWKSVQPGGSGLSTYLLEFAKDNYGTFTVQIPHSYKTGEDIKVHLHWTPGDRGNEENGNLVGWKIDYTWANINGTFGTMTTADLQDACDGTDWKHQMTPDITITGTDKGISSMLICNVKRTDTGDDDTWSSTTTGRLPLLLEVDFHFPVDTLGSRDWGSK